MNVKASALVAAWLLSLALSIHAQDPQPDPTGTPGGDEPVVPKPEDPEATPPEGEEEVPAPPVVPKIELPWLADYAAALEQARAKQQPILVYFWAEG